MHVDFIEDRRIVHPHRRIAPDRAADLDAIEQRRPRPGSIIEYIPKTASRGEAFAEMEIARVTLQAEEASWDGDSMPSKARVALFRSALAVSKLCGDATVTDAVRALRAVVAQGGDFGACYEALFDAEEKMEKAVSVARDDLASIRTGRANPGARSL